MFLKCGDVGFRQLEESDLEQLRDWRNLPEIRSRTREYAPLNLLDQEKWWESLLDRRTIMFGICNEHNNLIGVCGLVHIDWKNRNAEFSYYLGDAESRGKGYGRKAAYLLFEYGFNELGLHRIWAEVYANATEILIIDEKLGFKTEGIMREAYWNEGRWWDSHIVSVLSSEWDDMRGNYFK